MALKTTPCTFAAAESKLKELNTAIDATKARQAAAVCHNAIEPTSYSKVSYFKMRKKQKCIGRFGTFCAKA